MRTHPVISRIVYRRGLVSDPSAWAGLETTVLQGLDLVQEIVDFVCDNDLLTWGGIYGNPNGGDPLEVDELEITHEMRKTQITLFNRGIMLLQTDDEVCKRIHKLCCAIVRQKGSQCPPKATV